MGLHRLHEIERYAIIALAKIRIYQASISRLVFTFNFMFLLWIVTLI